MLLLLTQSRPVSVQFEPKQFLVTSTAAYTDDTQAVVKAISAFLTGSGTLDSPARHPDNIDSINAEPLVASASTPLEDGATSASLYHLKGSGPAYVPPSAASAARRLAVASAARLRSLHRWRSSACNQAGGEPHVQGGARRAGQVLSVRCLHL